MVTNKSRFVVFIALVVVMALNGCAKREIANIDSSGKNIVCFGDSLTFGYGARSGGDYPVALGQLLGIRVINAGIDGDTTIAALKRIKNDVLDRQPLLVVVEFGGNDFLSKIPKEETLRNVREMIAQIQVQGAMVVLVDFGAGMLLKEYRADFRKIASESQSIFIPNILSGILTNPGLKSDFIHPNEKGYKIIAQRIYDRISPYLKRNYLLRQQKE